MQRRTQQRATLKAVAELADVSVMTVSNVVNGRHSLMAVETRERVEAAIRRLGYVPITGARGMRLNRAYAFGLLVVEDSPFFLADPFVAQCVAGLSNKLGSSGYKLTIQGASPREYYNALYFKDISVDGLVVLMPGSDQERAKRVDDLKSLKLPIILLQERCEFDREFVCSLGFDQLDAARQMWSAISNRPVERLVLLEPDLTWPAIETRHTEITRLAKRRSKKTEIITIHCGTGAYASTKDALLKNESLLREGAVVVASNDRMGVGAIHATELMGLVTPDKIRVLGFHDFEFRQFAHPSLTTVRTSPYSLGETAAKLLLEWGERRTFDLPSQLLPVELLMGETT